METNFWIDILIGATLVNAMPHYVLGIWNARMVSGFGIGKVQNILWSMANLLLSLGLFLYFHGFAGFPAEPMYTGAIVLTFIFIVAAPLWHRILNKQH